MPRYANRQDNNSKEIDEALAKIPGLTIEKLGNWTIDRLIGFRGRNYLIEYKTPKGKLRDSQIEFLKHWTGQVNVCRSVEDVLLVLGVNELHGR